MASEENDPASLHPFLTGRPAYTPAYTDWSQYPQQPPSPSLAMPYRAELKRPDLKGTFPCSVCNKIFCHSSSLSRHRMQAHFKSYTCTLCNEEIASNETLRSHMFKSHQISRMFMCRCCNWAFPDKTSLHIHMQSMVRSGHPGDVNILAKGADAPGSALSPGMTPADLLKCEMRGIELNESDNGMDNSMVEDEMEYPSLVSSGASIFPNIPHRDDLFNKLRIRAAATQNAAKSMEGVKSEPTDSPLSQSMLHNQNGLVSQTPEQATTQSLLALWLANNSMAMNPYAAALNMSLSGYPNKCLNVSGSNGCPLDDNRETTKHDQSSSSPSPSHKDDHNSPNVSMVKNGNAEEHSMKVDPEDSIMENKQYIRSAISANPLNSLLYKKKLTGALRNRTKNDASLANFFHVSENTNGVQMEQHRLEGDEPCAKRMKSRSPSELCMDSLDPHNQQCSPTASHTSGSGPPLSAGSSDSFSPAKCSDCQVSKRELSLAENRNRFLESKVSSLENKIERLSTRVKTFEQSSTRHETEQGVLREQCETLESKLLACQDKALRFLEACGQTQEGGLKAMVEDLLNTTYFQYDKTRFPDMTKPMVNTNNNHETMAVV